MVLLILSLMLNIVYDVDKLLVASYPDMDWDDNGYIGGYDEDGNQSPGNDYNKKGQIEIAHTDPIYLALLHRGLMIGSRGDIDKAISGEYGDKIIGDGLGMNQWILMEIMNRMRMRWFKQII